MTNLLALHSTAKGKVGPSAGKRVLWRRDCSGISLIVGPFRGVVNPRCSYGGDYEAAAELAPESFHSLVRRGPFYMLGAARSLVERFVLHFDPPNVAVNHLRGAV